MEPLKVFFFGTSCSMPTPERNLSSVGIQFHGNNLLFDCPEGTQRQMMKTSFAYMRVEKIFLSHFHADHILGIPGLLATMALQERTEPMFIFGPRGIKEKVAELVKAANFAPTFQIVCKEIRKGIVFEEENFSISAVPLKHGAPCFGFVFLEKGKEGEFQRKKALDLGIPEGPMWGKLQKGETIKLGGKTFKPEQVMDYSKSRQGRKVSIIWDTLPNFSYVKDIAESDLLVHEATCLEREREFADKSLHSTAKQAAETAKKAKAKKLALTHISSRYKNPSEIEKEAKTEFENSIVAKDLLEIDV